MSRTQGKHEGFWVAAVEMLVHGEPQRISKPESIHSHILGPNESFPRCLPTGMSKFPSSTPPEVHPGGSGFFPGPECWTGPLRQFGSRAGAGGRGPNTSLISSVKEQISTDRAFTDGGPTQKICLKLGVSGQKDQKGSVLGHLRDSPAETCVSQRPPGPPWSPVSSAGSQGCGAGKCTVCLAVAMPRRGCLPPFLPHG